MIFSKLVRWLHPHGPEISIAIGTGMLIAAVPMAVKVSKEADRLMAEWKKERRRRTKPFEPAEPDIIDKIKVTWPCYIGPGLLIIGGASMIFGGAYCRYMRYATLGFIAEGLRESAQRLEGKIVEHYGQNEADKINREIMTEKAQEFKHIEPVQTKHGHYLILDEFTGVKFRSNLEIVNRAINELNYRMNREMFVGLYELYADLDLSQCITARIKRCGWNADNGLVDIRKTTYFDDEYQEPALAISYTVDPRDDYFK